MFLRSFKLFAAMLVAVLLSVACGGEAAPAPTGLVVTAGESTVTVSWDATPGVEYWLFFGPSSIAPTDTTSMQNWIGLIGGNVLLKVTSPYVVSGLANGVGYSFSVNGRTDGGPGGPGATPASTTPRIAGSNWSVGPTNPPGSNDLRSVTYGATTATTTTASVSNYVAAGKGGTLYSSLDATTWSAINSNTTSNLNGAAYFGTFKLVGDNGIVLTSPDVTTWTAQTSATTQNLYAITSNYSSLNVAVGANGTIITSPDGVTWTVATSPTTRDLYAVSYSNYNVGTNAAGTWIAVGASGTLVESADGATWSLVASNTSADLHGVTYGTTDLTTGATAFVVVGSSGTVLSSVDGVTWTPQTVPGASSLNAVTYGAQFVAVGAGGNIITSTNGVTWTLVSPAPTGSDLYALVHGPYAYSAVGAAGTNLLSK